MLNKIIKKILAAAVSVSFTLAGLIGISMLMNIYYQFRFQEETVYFIKSKLSVFPIVFAVSTILYFMLKVFRKNDSQIEQKITLLGMGVGFVVGIISLFSFDKYTLDGITAYSPMGEKNYSFDDVDIYHVSKSFASGSLKIQLKMTDGRKFTYIGGVLDAVSYENDKVNKLYSDDSYRQYILDTARIMKEKNAEGFILDMEKIESISTYDYWLEIAREIGRIRNE